MTDTDRLIRRFIGGDPAAAVTTRDRHLVAIAAAHLDGDHDRVRTLARDHLADHPDH